MLKTIDILDRMDLIEREQYKDMISAVNIPDFYKCVAQFGGLQISKVSDDSIYEYLYTWCRNKYKFFKMLGNKTRLDQPFIYNRPKPDLPNQIMELGRQFPAYYLWLKEFRGQEKNKIEVKSWSNLTAYCKEIFPQFNIDGTTMTHFFKRKLNAPDKLITAIGKLFENDKIEATHTISIDPIDMMFASENPYDWDSCYKLELGRMGSHADGCMAAILDSNSLITYVWSSEGKYDMYEMFKFKKVRYYRIRQWIAIADDWGAIHFNDIYPGRDRDNNIEKIFREKVEMVVSEYAKVDNIWRRNEFIQEGNTREYNTRRRMLYKCEREFYYGYNEFYSESIYINSIINPKKEFLSTEEYNEIEKNKDKNIKVYNEKIICPCGCGEELIGSDEYGEDYDGCEYNGEGFTAENIYEVIKYWCDYKEDDCDCECDRDCCEGCCYWEDAHPYCEICDMECPEGMNAPDVYDGYAHPDETCESICHYWRECYLACNLDKDNIRCNKSDEIETFDDDETGERVCNANEANCKGCIHWEDHKREEKGDAEDVD